MRAPTARCADGANAETPLRASPPFADAPARAFPAATLRASAALAAIGALVSACGTTPGPSSMAATVAAPASIERERIIGRWGVASFHNEKDRRRTEAEARAQCSQPYTIARGPTDGVMMHVADDPKLYELRLKGDAAGKTYLGFEAPPGDPQDREVLSATDRMVTMRFIDPDANRRYGTFVYVRCGA
jgi:hypothetical protein